jgi:hypothetical protein
MMGDAQKDGNQNSVAKWKPPSASASQDIDWYSAGDELIVEADGVQVVVRFVGRKGRRGRIKITAPPGAEFRTRARNKTARKLDRR